MVLFFLYFISANAYSQFSGLRINIENTTRVIKDGSYTIVSMKESIATLRVLVNDQQKIKLSEKDNISSSDQIKLMAADTSKTEAGKLKSAKTVVTKLNPLTTPEPILTTSGTIYDIPVATSLNQFTSLQANFKFLYNVHGLFQTQVSNFNAVQYIELYKLEKGTDKRSFCIPAGSCSSINIPIQITGNGLYGLTNEPAHGVFTVTIPSGYLQPGEYAFIDKSSLTADSKSLVCFPFTVKQ
jgi:hypothetical protein